MYVCVFYTLKVWLPAVLEPVQLLLWVQKALLHAERRPEHAGGSFMLCCLSFYFLLSFLFHDKVWYSYKVIRFFVYFKSNQIKSRLLSHHHSTCALVSEILESVLHTVQKQLTYRQYHYILTDLYRWQCAIYTYIYSVHTVLDILTVINTHYTTYVHILHYVHIYTYTVICNGAVDCT